MRGEEGGGDGGSNYFVTLGMRKLVKHPLKCDRVGGWGEFSSNLQLRMFP